MSWKTKQILITLTVFALSIFGGAQCPVPSASCLVPSAIAETIEVPNPLEYSNVDDLVSKKIRPYLLMIVGGIAIVMIAIAGIMYIIGGATGNDGMIEIGKKGVIGAIVGLVIILGASMIINEVYFIVAGEQYDLTALSASQILMRLINFLLAIVGTLFLISMVIGGIWFFAAGGDESKVTLGKKTVQYSLIGITVAVAAMVILRQIDKIITGGQG